MANDKENLQFLICSNCNGVGHLAAKKCQVCDGRGIIGSLDSYILFWDRVIDYPHLKLYKVERVIDFIIKVILLVIGLGGITSLVYSFYLTNFDYYQILSLNYWQSPNQYHFYFWLSLFFDLFIIYFNSLKNDRKVKVVAKKYQAEGDLSLLAPPPVDWQSVKGISHKYKIDISKTFSEEALKIVEKAYDLAYSHKALEVAPVHFLIAALLLSGKAQNVFIRLGIDLNDLSAKISRLAARYPQSETETVFATEARKIMIKAYRQAYINHLEVVETLDILYESVRNDEYIMEVFMDIGITPEKIDNVIVWFRIQRKLKQQWQLYRTSSKLKSKTGLDRAMTAVQTPLLNQFSEDLTMLAKQGYLDISVDRDQEFSEIYRVLEGSSIKAVIMVGEPGVGKTAIIEGLAQKMIADDLPDFLQDKRLVSLSIPKLVAGASISQVQERLYICFNEIARAGNVILYIDNIHDLIAMSGGSGLIEVLAEALSKNLFILISGSTSANYTSYIERSNLGNIIKKIEIKEPELNGAIQIIEGKAGYIENKNNVFLTYDALESAVKLTDRFIHDQFLPYKAITLLEEVAVWARKTKGANCLVTGNDVATLMSEKIGMKVTQITEGESEKLLKLEEIIHERMIDQEEAVSAVANSLRRARAELRETTRPIANLLFLGPTGVGKTELAKTIAEVYFGNEENMVRVDMSEYQEASAVNRLIGAPPGYAGSGGGGILTEAVRKKPYCIVLLDELEKAHPDILNLFLQVMDDGRLTDSSGRTIDFTNVILIATSNAQTNFIQQQLAAGLTVEAIKRQLLETELKQYFKPEFINRFDNIIIFKPLGLEEVIKITGLMLARVAQAMEAKGINFQATEEAVRELAQIGFDPQYGARPLRRAIQDHVDNALANYLITGKIGRRDVAILEKGGVIRVEKAREL